MRITLEGTSTELEEFFRANGLPTIYYRDLYDSESWKTHEKMRNSRYNVAIKNAYLAQWQTTNEESMLIKLKDGECRAMFELRNDNDTNIIIKKIGDDLKSESGNISW